MPSKARTGNNRIKRATATNAETIYLFFAGPRQPARTVLAAPLPGKGVKVLGKFHHRKTLAKLIGPFHGNGVQILEHDIRQPPAVRAVFFADGIFTGQSA